MKLKQAISSGFIKSVEKIGSGTKTIGAAFRLKSIRKQIDGETEKYYSIEEDLIKQYAKKNDKGAVIYLPMSDGRRGFTFDDPDKSEEFRAKMKELGEQEFELCGTLTEEDFQPDFLNGDDVYNLDGVIIEKAKPAEKKE